MGATALRALVMRSLLVFAVGVSLHANAAAAAEPHPTGEFFIVSSVDPVKHQILAKRPTEVTQIVRVDEQTKYFDRAKKPIGLNDVRAGDTVYITSSPSTGLAVEVRNGAMTVAELRRRYLNKQQ